MGEDEDLEDLKGLARGIVGMYKAVWDEVERQFPELSIEDRHRIFSLISPFINSMFAMAMKEGEMEDSATATGKSKKKRR
jgi:hypothetical protein